MPDRKNQSDKKPDDALPLPTPPAKQPRKDYTVLPQKPITLKREITTSPPLKGSTSKPKPKPKRKARTTPASIPKPKSPKAKAPSPASQWLLQGVSQAARNAASVAAEEAGVEVGKWLERLILEHVGPEKAEQPAKTDAAWLETLKSIDERLSHLENQRGFWIRFWDRFMEQH